MFADGMHCCMMSIIGSYFTCVHVAKLVHIFLFDTSLLTALAWQVMQSICFHSIFELTDLWPWPFACIWLMTIALLELKVKVTLTLTPTWIL